MAGLPHAQHSQGRPAGGARPESREMVALLNPRAERWEEHFEWIEDGTIIQGKSPQGRATVMALQMNHPDLVAARRLWVIAGWNPPME
jgi:hypothetical protein